MNNFRYVIDGIGYPSVTEILKCLDKPALTEWKKKTPNSEQISRDRATIGTIIHWKIQRYLAEKFELPPEPFRVDDLEVITHLHQGGTPEKCKICRRKADMSLAIGVIWSYFEDFLLDHTLEPIQLEKTVCNVDVGYAGTLDYYGRLDGDLVILDWKTARIFYKDNTYGAQLAAYKRAFKNNAKYLFVLRMNEDTGWGLREVEDDWARFQDAYELYRQQNPDRLPQKM